MKTLFGCKKSFLSFGMMLVLAFVCISGEAQQVKQRYIGSWSGTMDVNGSNLELVFNVSEDGCTMDVPAQGAKGIKAEFTQEAKGVIKILVPRLMAYFEGKYVNSKPALSQSGNIRIEGTFYQSGMQFPLTLKPAGPSKPGRPQTPQPPFPYSTEEVRFSNGSTVLSGTLTIPFEDGHLAVPDGSGMSDGTRIPAVILITGSGAQNRDEEMLEHRPFAVVADAFARAGIATLRYDDRGVGRSTGDFAAATTDTLASDAAAGIAFLRDNGFENVGALGHSEGGTIAFMLAAGDSAPDFVISMAGAIERGDSVLFSQVEAQALLTGASSSQAKFYARQMVDRFRSANDPWSTRFLELDPAPYIRNVKCRVLAINGEKDMQVLPQRNIPLLQELLPSAEVKIYPGLNHLFQHCGTGLPAEYYNIEETISPEVLEDMVRWILK